MDTELTGVIEYELHCPLKYKEIQNYDPYGLLTG